MSTQSSKKKLNVNPDLLQPLDKISLACIYISSVIVPLIIYMHPIPLNGDLYKFWTGDTTHYDFFSWSKTIVLKVCLVVFALYWIYKVFHGKLTSLPRLFVPLGIYTLMLTLSTFGSRSIDVAMNGFTDRWEGFFVLLCYVLLTLSAATVIRDTKQVINLFVVILLSSVIIALLGLTQFYGHDFLQTSLGKQMILPPKFMYLADTLNFKFSASKVMYTTVYNPNYLGSYSVLLLPISIGLFYILIKDKLWKRVVMGFFIAISFILWLGGLSRAGLLGGVVMLVILIVFLRKQIIKNWLSSVVILLMMASIYLVMDSTSGGEITREFYNTLPSSVQSMFNKPMTDQEAIPNSSESPTPSESPQDSQTSSEAITPSASPSPTMAANPQSDRKRVTKVELKDNVLTFMTIEETLLIKFEPDGITLMDENQNVLTPIRDGDKVTIADNRYSEYSILIDTSGIRLTYADIDIPIVLNEGKMKLAVSKGLLYDQIGPVPTVGFKNAEAFASGRGFIWSRSIPMIKDTLVLGHGPDTFPIYFPQQDIAGKINGLYAATVIVDKPHNWYLQLAINTGVISLIAMIVFLAWFWLKGLRKWFKAESKDQILGIAILCAVAGYCIAALFNDSNVAVAPVFWVILGTGIALLRGSIATAQGKSGV